MSLSPLTSTHAWAVAHLTPDTVGGLAVSPLPVSEYPLLPPMVIIGAPYLAPDEPYNPGCGYFAGAFDVFVVGGGHGPSDLTRLYSDADAVIGRLVALSCRLGALERTGWSVDPDPPPLPAYRIPVTITLQEVP